MSENKKLDKEDLEEVSGGGNWTTDYYCKNCQKVTSPKTILLTKNDNKETQYEHQVCSICGGEYAWSTYFHRL